MEKLGIDKGGEMENIKIPERLRKIFSACDAAENEFNSWVANDGGLTMAASDGLSIVNVIRNQATELSYSEFEDWFPKWASSSFDCDSGTEDDLISAIYQTMPKEKNLRKTQKIK